MSNTEVQKEKPKKLPLPIKLAVGAVAGVFGATCMYPLDMVKTRLQAGDGKISNPIKVAMSIIKDEGGIRGLYRGLAANLVGITPEKAIKLAANDFFRERLENEDGSISLMNEIISGGSAGVCHVIATNPMEITKIRMQMQATLPPAERLTTVQVVKQLGIRGLYQGTTVCLLRDVPFSIVFFPAYANLKPVFADKKTGENSLISLIAAGFIAGATAAGCVTPSDVIKTRLQVLGGAAKYKNPAFAFQKILKEEGPSALFKGAIPRMAVIGPLFAITLCAFEAQKSYMVKNGLL